MLADSLDAGREGQAPLFVAGLHRRVPEVEAEPLEQLVNALLAARGEHADLDRVTRIERQPDRDRFAVAKLVRRQALELVRGPVAVVEWPRATGLERIAAVRDLAHVQFGAAADHLRHRGR